MTKMKRVQLIHWRLIEVDERIDRLVRSGFDAFHVDLNDPNREKGSTKPDAYVIDLSRLPSHGRTVAMALRQSKSTRCIPIVFVDGEAEKVAAIKIMFPDAAFTKWSQIKTTLNRSITRPPKDPVVPKSESGAYSGTPLPKKLGVNDGSKVLLINAPKKFEELLEPLPVTAIVTRKRQSNPDLIIWFVDSNAVLEARIDKIANQLDMGGLWIAWPKKTSGVATDLKEDAVRSRGLACGLVDYKVCAIDETWSGLKFARRKK